MCTRQKKQWPGDENTLGLSNEEKVNPNVEYTLKEAEVGNKSREFKI